MSGSTARTIDPETLLAQAGWVRALALRLVRDEAGADDVLQDTFVAAIERPPREDVPVRPWLARVARNFALRRLRGDGRRARREAAAPSLHSAQRTPAETAAQAECFREVVDAVLALEPPYREVVLLRFFEGLEAAEVARRLGVPEETVRTRLKRALATLRARLDSRYGGDRRAWAVLLVPSGAGDGADSGGAARGPGLTRTGIALVTAAAALVLVLALLVPWDGGGGAAPAEPGKSGLGRAAQSTDDAGRDGVGPDAKRGPTTADAARGARANRAAPPEERADDAPPPPPVAPPAFIVRVVDEEDRPVRDGTLRILPSAPDDIPDEAKAALAALPPTVELAAANPYMSPALPATTEGVTIRFVATPRDGPPTDAADITLSAAQVEEAKVVVRPPRTIRVHVIEHGTKKPVPHAWVVSVTEAARRELDLRAIRGQGSAASSETDDGGVCVLENLGAGTHRLKARAAGHTQFGDVWSNGGSDARIEMDPWSTGTVHARSMNLDGTPAVGSHVSIGDEGGVVGEDGTLVIEDVPKGERELFLMEQMIGRAPLGGAPSERIGVWICERRFVMEPGARIDVGVGYVRGDGTVVAEVVDGAGLPLRGVRVELIDPGIRTADTSPDGIATFREVPDGTLRWNVIRTADRPEWMWTESTPLARGETRRLRVVLADAEVTGTVGTDGIPWPEEAVVVLDGRGLYPQRVAPRGGSFAFREVPAGRYWLRAEGTGVVSRPREILVGEGPIAPVALSFSRGGLLVIESDVRSARLLVSDTESVELVSDGRAAAPAWDEPRGIVSGPYAAGTLRLAVAGADGRALEKTVEIEDGAVRGVGLPRE